MIVGNDIVDTVEAGPFCERFARRVCAPEEQREVTTSADRARTLWELWAAKEAAYKALARRDGHLRFAHGEFRVDRRTATVRHASAALSVVWTIGPTMVACVAWQGAGSVVSAWSLIADADGALGAREAAQADTAASRAVRCLAKRLLGEALGMAYEDLEILRPARPRSERRSYGPPEVWHRGERLPALAVTLAHDGGFVACALGQEAA